MRYSVSVVAYLVRRGVENATSPRGRGPDHYCERLEQVPKRHRGARQGKR